MSPLAASAAVALAEINSEIGDEANQFRFHLSWGGGQR